MLYGIGSGQVSPLIATRIWQLPLTSSIQSISLVLKAAPQGGTGTYPYAPHMGRYATHMAPIWETSKRKEGGGRREERGRGRREGGGGGGGGKRKGKI